jgi:uncharacterized MAPEG superfamily protein
MESEVRGNKVYQLRDIDNRPRHQVQEKGGMSRRDECATRNENESDEKK